MAHREIILQQKLPSVSPVSFGFEKCRPSHSYGPAVRTHWLLHYVEAGFGTFTVQGSRHLVSPGSIFVIPPYQEISYQADLKQPWEYIWIGFLADGAMPDAFDHPVLQCPGAGSIFQKMKTCHDFQNGRNWFLCAGLMELIALLSEQSPSEEDYVLQAISYMHAEFAQPMNVTLLADQLGIDRSYFSAMFVKKMGVSPGKFLERLRLEKAAELLLNHGCMVSTAALSCGYQDQAHFSKRFKAHFGVSPRDFRTQQKMDKNQDHTA